MKLLGNEIDRELKKCMKKTLKNHFKKSSSKKIKNFIEKKKRKKYKMKIIFSEEKNDNLSHVRDRDGQETIEREMKRCVHVESYVNYHFLKKSSLQKISRFSLTNKLPFSVIYVKIIF